MARNPDKLTPYRAAGPPTPSPGVCCRTAPSRKWPRKGTRAHEPSLRRSLRRRPPEASQTFPTPMDATHAGGVDGCALLRPRLDLRAQARRCALFGLSQWKAGAYRLAQPKNHERELAGAGGRSGSAAARRLYRRRRNRGLLRQPHELLAAPESHWDPQGGRRPTNGDRRVSLSVRCSAPRRTRRHPAGPARAEGAPQARALVRGPDPLHAPSQRTGGVVLGGGLPQGLGGADRQRRAHTNARANG